MKKIGDDNELARVAQAKMWGLHLQQQFEDRQVYWTNRSLSRIGQDIDGEKVVTLIIDSMDRSKWAIPRSEVLAAKSFNGLHRPVLDCAGIIAHGHYLAIAFSEPHLPKGANWTIELLSILFHRLVLNGCDLRQYRVIIQADNASKEAKSNSVLRYLSYMIARKRIRAARVCFCMSGHNHEDIDQMFSLLGAFLATQRELRSPQEFLGAVNTYLSNPSVRPEERNREAIKVDSVRAWIFG